LRSYRHVVFEIRLKVQAGTRDLMVLSKWGADGEYIHALGDVPALLGVPREFWTDRRPCP
jgi:hypothetical protein